jgi:quercetin dioxygenase-like cupin family protein
VFLGENTYTLEEGDALTFSGDILHGYKNERDEIVEVIWVVTPATY